VTTTGPVRTDCAHGVPDQVVLPPDGGAWYYAPVWRVGKPTFRVVPRVLSGLGLVPLHRPLSFSCPTMARSCLLPLAVAIIAGLAGCQQGSPTKQSQVRYQKVPPSKRYSVVDVKRFQPDQLAQVPKGARCTVETRDINRSVTGWVQSSGADGIVLVNAEEIVARTEVPSNMNGKGYEHKPRDRVQLTSAEVASVRVFRE
jgi:hypothetical protein